MKKIIKVSTVPESLADFCKGQLKMLSSYYDIVAISSPLKELDEIKQRENIRTIGLPMERHISLVKDIVSLCAMIKIIHREKPFIVHSMTPKAGLISMIAAWINRVPIRMHTYTGLVFPTSTGFTQRILVWMDRILCFCANYINPEGNGVAGDLKKYHITNKPLHIIGNGNVRGIDETYWNPELKKESDVEGSFETTLFRKKIGINIDDYVLLFVGRLVGDKGINELVESFVKIQQSHSHIKLLLVGPYEPDLDPLSPQTIDMIDSNPNIITVGIQEDVRPYYLISDLFVFPSYREGFPNTVLEAGAMGLPQIVTNINGSNEIIKDGLNGKIIQVRDSNALYKSIIWFMNHPGEQKRMAGNARQMILNRFNQDYIWGELLKVYQSFEINK